MRNFFTAKSEVINDTRHAAVLFDVSHKDVLKGLIAKAAVHHNQTHRDSVLLKRVFGKLLYFAAACCDDTPKILKNHISEKACSSAVNRKDNDEYGNDNSRIFLSVIYRNKYILKYI